jgi:hypothetical protein
METCDAKRQPASGKSQNPPGMHAFGRQSRSIRHNGGCFLPQGGNPPRKWTNTAGSLEWTGRKRLSLLSGQIIMAKKKSAKTAKLVAGQAIRIKPGVAAPEFPEMSCAGWTGVIMELIGKKTDPQYVVEWDQLTLDHMPQSYKDQCEERNLTYSFSCFSADDMEVVEE